MAAPMKGFLKNKFFTFCQCFKQHDGIRVHSLHKRSYIKWKDMAERSAWETHYKSSDQSIDWLLSYGHLKHVILPAISPIMRENVSFKIIDIGCGQSDLIPQLLLNDLNNTNAYCTDFSYHCIEQLRNKFHQLNIADNCTNGNTRQDVKSCNRLNFVNCDAQYLPFQDETVNCIIDKGTTDAVLKDVIKGKKIFEKIVCECFRILHKDGSLIQITDEVPELRVPLLELVFSKFKIQTTQFSLSFKIIEDNEMEYYVYFIKKG
ncbi:unnamed protein product [Owenia fusiformis]|uniref:Uncharacterized protein n=1 Tax=Owenia fusiformis TaxID=6347 RepID=A0A8J1U1A1_OWEFU|nr:unnamed protein product [Owenia fusiformis]